MIQKALGFAHVKEGNPHCRTFLERDFPGMVNQESLDAQIRHRSIRSYLKTQSGVWAGFLNPMAKADEALSHFEGGERHILYF